MVFVESIRIQSPNVHHTATHIESAFSYPRTIVTNTPSGAVATPVTDSYTLRTATAVPRTGLLLAGLGGNNGTTVTGGIIANREGITWRTKDGVKAANYFGSIMMSSTVRVGTTAASGGEEDVYAPLRALVPTVHPNDLVIGGWDISGLDLGEAMRRAAVFDYDLQVQLEPHLREMKPMPAVFDPEFVAANQMQRADNIVAGTDKKVWLDTLRQNIRDFKAANALESLVVLWTANTERFAEITPGVNDTAANLMAAIEASHPEVSPSTIYAVASILEGCPYINGSPQNTFVPGCVELAIQHNVFIAGDDFKSGQTKYKSVMVDFLVQAGLKPTSIVSYNHLGNNDGKNLSAPAQFRSKEISKSNVVDDMVASNELLYEKSEHPDHVVVIKYVPNVGDSKRAMDEYTSSIFMGGTNTIVSHNVCEDSLLASPLILDLAILAELSTRISYKTPEMKSFEHFHPVLSLLSYLLKAPLVPDGAPVVNALFKQRSCIENFLRACVGLPPENDMRLETRHNPRVRDVVESDVAKVKSK